MSIRNVLVFPAGTEIGLEINAALKNCKEINLYGAGLPDSNHGPFAFEKYFITLSIYDDGWLEQFINLCKRLKIDYIFPAYDDAIIALSEAQDQIPAKILTSPLETCRVTRSKRDTYEVLKDIIRVPIIFDGALPAEDKYPLFLKPNKGQGSQGATIITNESNLLSKKAEIKDPLLCEYLPGEEFTVDCFSDREAGLLFCGARIRNRMRNGIAVSTSSIDLPGIDDLARKINSKLSLRGAWFFQVKRASDGELVLLEIAPRIAGSMSTHRVLGINFPLLTIYEDERLNIKILESKRNIDLDRALINRYKHSISFSKLYIDLDDTLILKGAINLEAIALIYKCINDGIKITLLTRHKGDIDNTLSKYKMKNIFDEIIHVKTSELKSSYINESDAIFVDDSFSERIDVHEKCRIPTFDCSMIEMLINTHQKLNVKN